MPSVLIVEDDDSIRNMNTMAFTMEGFEVFSASSGAEALVRVGDRSYDVILLDMLMTGMSGLDFLKEYDATSHPETKIIALTNMSNPAIEEKARSMGAIGYLDKSAYEPQQLTTYVKQLLGQEAPPK